MGAADARHTPAAFATLARVTEVYLEAGKRRVFACAVYWPGWCRAAKTEEAALSALAASAPRYSPVCALAGIIFDASSVAAALEVVERVAGSATTDFGALDVPPGIDGTPLTAQEASKLAALVEAAWQTFGDVAAAAPAELRKGPRGGGRDKAAIVAHVLETEVLHARMLGLRHRPFPPGEQAAADLVRAEILAAIRSAVPVPQRGTAGAASPGRALGAAPPPMPPEGAARGRRPARFVARRTAWHALDHAWEIQDRL